MTPPVATALTRDAEIEVPLICGAMYPCSNPELVAAASEAGAIGIVQPVSLTYVHGWDFREGLRKIRSLTARPIGFNALIEASSRTYAERMDRWIEIALEEGVRFFVTSLGKPDAVTRRVHEAGGKVYHDVTSRKWAQKGVDCGVDGLIAVNRDAGGHAGPTSAEALLAEVGDLGVPVVCAGGVATPHDFARVLGMGYVGAQCGTRFIATEECSASDEYKAAVVDADAEDIVLTERITGVPVAVIDTPWVRAVGTRANAFERWMLKGQRRKHWMRTIYALRSLRKLKKSLAASGGTRTYWQAGRSVRGIDEIRPTARIVHEFMDAARAMQARGGIEPNQETTSS
jgi:nitronate monooxygenase